MDGIKEEPESDSSRPSTPLEEYEPIFIKTEHFEPETLPIMKCEAVHSVDIDKEESDSGKDAALGMSWDVTPNKEELKDEVTIEDNEVSVNWSVDGRCRLIHAD
ncbi:uncharacterized protein LOC110833395 isoform X2 [Zootermopsis nevadensis]|uniref:uncharacterized protein LOC110833395 isoform X2 n=1 Tax=Zootermopsis nevadensis TaxID=136037 RepID=UPI000B8EBC04|nr:uncharacterized protein LOC110833395 isoform X2 [Zootermopsis nevadensis]